MHLRLSRYSVFIALLSLASAACLAALAQRYAAMDAQYQLSFQSYASLMIPSLICAAFWIWWKDPLFRVAGCCIGLVLFIFCLSYLITGPVGGDMDFGAPFIAGIVAIGCFVLSVVALVVLWILTFLRTRMHKKPLHPVARDDAHSG